jgi:hypothetical protein
MRVGFILQLHQYAHDPLQELCYSPRSPRPEEQQAVLIAEEDRSHPASVLERQCVALYANSL